MARAVPDRRQTHCVWSFFMVVKDSPDVVTPFRDWALEVNCLIAGVVHSTRRARIAYPNAMRGVLPSVFELALSLMVSPRHRLFLLSNDSSNA